MIIIMKRRDFIKNTVMHGTVLSASSTIIGCKTTTTSQPTPDPSSIKSQILLPSNPEAPEKLPSGVKRTVMVLGGGIAGLSAALELAERGYSVTLREAAPFLGGRLHTRTESLSVGEFKIEHGLHMWFEQYYNFQDVLKRLNVWDKHFKPFNDVFFTFKTYEPEVIKSEGFYPANLLGIINRSPNLNLLTALETFRALPDIIFYNHANHFQKFDNILFKDWAKATGVNKKFYDIIMEPAASVSLNDPEKVSASEMLLNMHFFFIGNPKAFNRYVTTTDHGTAVIDPWAERLKSLGVTIELNSPVSALEFANNKCLGPSDRDENFDYTVMATDVPGTKSIFSSSTASDSSSKAKLDKLSTRFDGLKVAPSYRVLRVWFDKPIASKLTPAQAVIETPQHPPINLIAVFDMLEEESHNWAKANSGCILEYHLYNTPELSGLSPREIWNTIKSEAVASFAQTDALDLMASATPIDFSIGSYENFTSYEVGQAAAKPSVQTAKRAGIDNLFFAGDWVKFESFPNALMERSVTTGREAANNILLKDGVRQVEIVGANPRGPGVFPDF